LRVCSLEEKGGNYCVACWQYGLSIDRQIIAHREAVRMWLYRYVILSRRNSFFVRLIVYDSFNCGKKQLSEVPCRVLDRWGYHWKNGVKGNFLRKVGRTSVAYKRVEIPHEIVWPRVSRQGCSWLHRLMPLQHSGKCGWRIYGDPEPSPCWQDKNIDRQGAKAEAFLSIYLNDTKNRCGHDTGYCSFHIWYPISWQDQRRLT
jgi:hypothetical protein